MVSGIVSYRQVFSLKTLLDPHWGRISPSSLSRFVKYWALMWNLKYLLYTALVFGSMAAIAEPPMVLFLGDSITAGYGVRRDEAFPYVIEKQMQSENHPVRVINGAESGALSASALPRLKWYLRRIKPNLIVLTIGGNDARQGRAPADIESDIRAVIQFAQSQKLKVLLGGMRIFPNLGAQYSRDFHAIYRHLHEQFHVPWVPFVLEGVAGKKDLNQNDGFHPNAQGHALIAKTLLPIVEKNL
jgi:acyl-CoA thioesterase-1